MLGSIAVVMLLQLSAGLRRVVIHSTGLTDNSVQPTVYPLRCLDNCVGCDIASLPTPPLSVNRFQAFTSKMMATSTIPGTKHGRAIFRNEDAILTSEFTFEAEYKEDNTNPVKRYARAIWMYDGHGSNPNDVLPAGGTIARSGASMQQQFFNYLLPSLLRAPVLPPSHTAFATKSRQAYFAETFNLVVRAIKKTFPSLSYQSGSTALSVFYVSDDNNKLGGTLLAANLGDSMAYGFNYVQLDDGQFALDSVIRITVEHNIRKLHQQNVFYRKLVELGYRAAGVAPPPKGLKSNLHLVMVPVNHPIYAKGYNIADYEPFRTIADVKSAVVAAKPHLAQDEQFEVYAIDRSLYVTKLCAKIFNDGTLCSSRFGIQLTSTVGDLTMANIKDDIRTASNVTVLRLHESKKSFALVVAGTDGLWGAIRSQYGKDISLGETLARTLKTYGAANDVTQITKGLVYNASLYSTDDVSAVVSIVSYRLIDIIGLGLSRYDHMLSIQA